MTALTGRASIESFVGLGVDSVIAAARQFVPGCRRHDLQPLGEGLINDTYRIAKVTAGQGQQQVLQRLNTRVFKRPRLVMENIARVSAHMDSKWQLRAVSDPQRHYLKLVPSSRGRSWWIDPAGDWWRCFQFVRDSYTVGRLDDAAAAFQAGLSFGSFAADLADLPGPDLHLTIPGFHDTLGRLRTLELAFSAHSTSRGRETEEELSRIRVHSELAESLQTSIRAGDMPMRVVHNDTKVDNLLFDRNTGEALCVIDLDTVMPGRLVHDFGDLVRNGAAINSEDGKPGFSIQLFTALVEGYLVGAGALLSAAEMAYLPHAGPLMALELAARFLTDYLLGDRYFKTAYPQHNLDRCRSQLALLEAMVRNEREMVDVVTSAVQRIAGGKPLSNR